MFEHTTLQEAYTGALIAGKGKTLNNIRDILERARLPTADWARVRFGAGTPWRRCWCVITPPDEKEVQKLQKQVGKKKSVYDKTNPPILKGTIKFYDTKKTKKVRPIATISDAYSAYAIYPQSKPLIDASTLVKLEGAITIESSPPMTTEGFLFVMPEAHAAVSGFEILLRWLFPTYDTFGLYGRPTRLIADVNDTRSLMFAMPTHKRYGYLEILDVTSLILESGSSGWRESEWRLKMKELTAKRMKAVQSSGSRRDSRYGSRRSARNSFGPSRSRIQFDDAASVRSNPSISFGLPPQHDGTSAGIARDESAPVGATAFTPSPSKKKLAHHRSVSEAQGLDRFPNQSPMPYGNKFDADQPPPPPPHLTGISPAVEQRFQSELPPTPERFDSDDERQANSTPVQELRELQSTSTPEPVAAPPAFQHGPGARPVAKPYNKPELRRENSRMSSATLAQLAGASGVVAAHQAAEEQRRQDMRRTSEDDSQRGVMSDATTQGFNSNTSGPYEGLANTTDPPRYSYEESLSTRQMDTSTNHSHPIPVSHISHSNINQHSELLGRSSEEQAAGSSLHNHPPVPVHRPQQSAEFSAVTPSRPTHTPRQSISRKPIPSRSTSSDEIPQSQHAPQGRAVMNQAAYERLRQGDPHPALAGATQRNNSGFSSVYGDDNASTASPDYASTHRSFEATRATDRPRAGVMRTVGNPENQANENLVPDINFGPTMNYAAMSSKPLPPQPQGTPSPGPESHYSSTALAYSSLPVRRPESAGNSRSPVRDLRTSENQHARADSGTTRTMAWQPAMASPGYAPAGFSQNITAEEFVQQRANARPMYAHQRQGSSGNLIRGQTPPLVRNRSSEMLQQMHSRNQSVDAFQRPSSRSANVALGPHHRNASADALQRPTSRGPNRALTPTQLSAREQEHVSRATGQPLVNMAQNRPNSRQGPGLVGAIQQREIEKQQAKQGINSQAVQNAINQRQQQQMYTQQAQYGGNMQQRTQVQTQQPQFKNASHQAYWAAAPTTGATHNYNQRTSPGQAPQQQKQSIAPQSQPSPQQQGQQSQQYFPPQQGRGNGGYHGNGN